MGKVRFGLKNVHYAVLNEEEGTFGTPVAVKGSVSLTLDPEGDTSTFYADDGPYAIFTTNNGYSGTIEIAAAEDQMLQDLLGYVDDSGVQLEFTDAKQATFALMFEVSGNEVEQRTCLYSCKLNRSSSKANTKQDSTDPDTQSFDFKMTGFETTFKGETRTIAKATLENTAANKEKFKTFFDKVYIPTAAAA